MMNPRTGVGLDEPAGFVPIKANLPEALEPGVTMNVAAVPVALMLGAPIPNGGVCAGWNANVEPVRLDPPTVIVVGTPARTDFGTIEVMMGLGARWMSPAATTPP